MELEIDYTAIEEALAAIEDCEVEEIMVDMDCNKKQAELVRRGRAFEEARKRVYAQQRELRLCV